MSESHDRATHHYNLGIQFERNDDIDNAAREFENAIRADCRFPYPYRALGEIYFNKGRYEDALEHLEKAIELDPDWIEALGLAADTLIELGDTRKAAPLLERALRGDPGNPRYSAQLGRILIAEGDFSDAVELLEGALRANPDDYKLNYNMGVALGKRAMADIDLSIEHWRRAVAVKADDPRAFRNMAISYFSRGFLDEASDAFRKALSLDPNDDVSMRFLKFAEAVTKRG